MKRFRGGLVFKAHRLLYRSTLGLSVIKKKKKEEAHHDVDRVPAEALLGILGEEPELICAHAAPRVRGQDMGQQGGKVESRSCRAAYVGRVTHSFGGSALLGLA